jgi:hypothetical protein
MRFSSCNLEGLLARISNLYRNLDVVAVVGMKREGVQGSGWQSGRRMNGSLIACGGAAFKHEDTFGI